MPKTPSSSTRLSFLRVMLIVNFAFLCLLALGLYRVKKQLLSLQSIVTQQTASPVPSAPAIVNVSYSCDNRKTIQATYFDGRVELELSDGRSWLLMQGMSGSGVRYTNDNESFTFWSKGSTAFIEEGTTTTYNNCTQQGS